MFDMPDPLAAQGGGGKTVRRMEHFWLCGVCCESLTLEKDSEKSVQIIARPLRHRHAPVAIRPTAMAS